MQEVQDSGMLYRSSDCIFSRRLEKTSFSHFDERFSYLDERFSDFVTRIGHVFMSHRYHGFHRYFFESRKRRGYEPFSLSLAAIVSPMREVHRRLGGEKQGEIITQMKARRHGYITQISRISQMFLRTRITRIQRIN